MTLHSNGRHRDPDDSAVTGDIGILMTGDIGILMTLLSGGVIGLRSRSASLWKGICSSILS